MTPSLERALDRASSARRLTSVVVLQFADLATLTLAYCVALQATEYGLRGMFFGRWLDWSISMRQLAGLGVCLLAWHVLLHARGLYGSYRLVRTRQMLLDIAHAVMLTTVPVVVPLGVVGGLSHTDGIVLASFPVLAFVGLALERLCVRAVVTVLRALGRNLRYAVVVGDARSAARTAALLTERESLGYVVVNTLDVTARSDDGKPFLEDFEAILDRHPVDEVFVDLPFSRHHALIGAIAGLCHEQGSIVRIVANLGLERHGWRTASTLVDQPIVTVGNTPYDPLYLSAKRLLDLLVSTVVVVTLAPLFVAIAIAIKLDSPGLVFFAQERVGQNRRRFRAYKFRTMVPNAEALQAELEAKNEATGAIFKMREDPRVTRLGSWLRRTSLDELPQFFNVLRGEMSLVGPRPLPLRDVNRIDVRWHKRRFAVKPGITCLWQVNSREPNFNKLITADMDYIERQSFTLDLKILAKTVPAVLLRQGVH